MNALHNDSTALEDTPLGIGIVEGLRAHTNGRYVASHAFQSKALNELGKSWEAIMLDKLAERFLLFDITRCNKW